MHTIHCHGGRGLRLPESRGRDEAIVAALPAGLGTLTSLEGTGHFLHAERPDDTAASVASFILERVNASHLRRYEHQPALLAPDASAAAEAVEAQLIAHALPTVSNVGWLSASSSSPKS